jgi:hypothetical protein
MRLIRRPSIYLLPSYSLTGDLLGFLRCGLQYRYTRIGKLPSTRPVQLWFGQFIHGVLEESFRRFDTSRKAGKVNLPPWDDKTINEICDFLKESLAAQGIYPYDPKVEVVGDERAKRAINELGPELFPLIRRAEVRLTGSRALPISKIPKQYQFRESDRFEMVGVIDVISNVELSNPSVQNNRFVKAILQGLPSNLPNTFEVIIDYKGMRRPPIKIGGGQLSYWEIYGWQVQTYAELRRRQEESLPVTAGVVIYLNELFHTKADFELLKKEIKDKTTDVIPEPGSKSEQLISGWSRGEKPPELPLEFRFKRALRVEIVNQGSADKALAKFDEVVAKIEVCRGRELASGKVLSSWEKNATDKSTCAACDSRTFCPEFSSQTTPRLPAVRVRK